MPINHPENEDFTINTSLYLRDPYQSYNLIAIRRVSAAIIIDYDLFPFVVREVKKPIPYDLNTKEYTDDYTFIFRKVLEGEAVYDHAHYWNKAWCNEYSQKVFAALHRLSGTEAYYLVNREIPPSLRIDVSPLIFPDDFPAFVNIPSGANILEFTIPTTEVPTRIYFSHYEIVPNSLNSDAYNLGTKIIDSSSTEEKMLKIPLANRHVALGSLVIDSPDNPALALILENQLLGNAKYFLYKHLDEFFQIFNDRLDSHFGNSLFQIPQSFDVTTYVGDVTDTYSGLGTFDIEDGLNILFERLRSQWIANGMNDSLSIEENKKWYGLIGYESSLLIFAISEPHIKSIIWQGIPNSFKDYAFLVAIPLQDVFNYVPLSNIISNAVTYFVNEFGYVNDHFSAIAQELEQENQAVRFWQEDYYNPDDFQKGGTARIDFKYVDWIDPNNPKFLQTIINNGYPGDEPPYAVTPLDCTVDQLWTFNYANLIASLGNARNYFGTGRIQIQLISGDSEVTLSGKIYEFDLDGLTPDINLQIEENWDIENHFHGDYTFSHTFLNSTGVSAAINTAEFNYNITFNIWDNLDSVKDAALERTEEQFYNYHGGDEMVDSIRIKQIHAALGADRWAYFLDNMDEEQSAIVSLGEKITYIAQALGISYELDGSLKSIRQRKNVLYNEFGEVTIPSGWARGQFALNTGDGENHNANDQSRQNGGVEQATLDRLGIAYQMRGNKYASFNADAPEESVLRRGDVVLCENLIQYYESFLEDFGKALGVENLSALVLPAADNSGFCSFEGLDAAIAEILYMQSASSINTEQTHNLAIQNHHYNKQLIKALGLPIGNKMLQIDTGEIDAITEDPLIANLPLPVISEDAPNITQQLFGIMQNIGQLISASQPKVAEAEEEEE